MMKTSIRAIRASNRSSVKRVKALAQSGDQLTRQVNTFVLGEITNLLSASANNPDPGQSDSEYDALIGEMQDLLEQQQQAAVSQTKCWTAFVDNTEGIRILLSEKRKKHQPLTLQDKLRIGKQIEGAIAAYMKCLTLPRPKRVAVSRD